MYEFSVVKYYSKYKRSFYILFVLFLFKLSAIANKMVFSLHDFFLLPLVFNRCRSSQLSAVSEKS